MNNFRDLEALHHILTLVYQQAPGPAGQALLSEALEGWGYTKDQASLYASTVLSRNSDGTADRVRMYSLEIVGNWVRGKMEGMAAGWLNTMQETWSFNEDLTYELKHETYEGYSTPSSPYFQARYSRPTASVERGIWAAGDWRGDDGILPVVVIAASGFARTLAHAWTDKDTFYHQGCFIDGEHFGRQL